MRPERVAPLVRPLVFVSALALLLDLFLDWRVAQVTTPAVDISAGTSGWSGWGALAGVFLIAFFAWELRVLVRERVSHRQDLAVSTLLAFGGAGFAIVGFFTGSASVNVAGTVAVSTEEVRFAAYVGLVLAFVLAVTAAARYVRDARAQPVPPPARPHAAV